MSLKLDAEAEVNAPSKNALIHKLASKNNAEAEAASRRLIERGDEGVEALITTLAEQEEARKRRFKMTAAGFIGIVGAMVVIGILTGKAMIFSMMGAFTGILAGAAAASNFQKQGILQLAQLEDVRTVGVLIEALDWNDASLASEAQTALSRLLPRLKESDAALFTPARRKILLKQLAGVHHAPEFSLAVLKGLEQIGGEEALPIVTQIAEGTADGGKFPEVCEAAVLCLPFLRHRAERNENSRRLLRASSENDHAKTLLRPAAEVSETDKAAHLLRPAEESDLS